MRLQLLTMVLRWVILKMVVRPNSQIVDALSQKLTGGRVAMKILNEELKPAAERLKPVQLDSGWC